MDKSNQYDYIKAYNAENYKTFSIKISPEEWAEIDEISKKMNISKARLTVNAIRLYAETVAQNNAGNITETHSSLTAAGTLTASTDNPGEDHTAGATETPTDERQDGQPDYISTAGNAPQRATQNATERAGEDQPEKIRIYTETELKQAIQEAAQQAAQKAARQARQEIKREMKAQAIRATGRTIEAARRTKAATVSTVNGLKPLRIRRGKK